jgi:hypothetical protein
MDTPQSMNHMSSSSTSRCQCVIIPDVAVIGMGSSHVVADGQLSDRALETLDVVQERGRPFWWLDARRCRVCGQSGLVAQEERQHDNYCLRRISTSEMADIAERNRWPADFDRYEALLEMAVQAGQTARLVDPLTDKSIPETIEDLARERPSIRVSELARLLNVDTDVVHTLATRVARSTGAPIDLDR